MDAQEQKGGRNMHYKDLKAWKLSRDLAVDVYSITDRDSFKWSWGLRDQIQRSATSIPSNIAEGDERGTNRDTLRFLYISKGSLAELRTQLEIARATGRVGPKDYDRLEALADHVARLISGLIRKRVERERRDSTANP